MAREATISDLIGELRYSTAESKENTVELKTELVMLNNQFSDYFDMLNQQRLDNLDEKREKKAENKEPQTKFGGMVGDAKDEGFLGIIAVVLAAATGFLVGIVEGITRAFTLSLKGLNALLKGYPTRILKSITNITKNIFRPIIGFFDAIGDAFRKAGTGKIVRNRQFLGKGLAPITNFFTGLKNFFRAAVNPFVRMGDDLKILGKAVPNFFGKISKSVRTAVMSVSEGAEFFKDIAKLKDVFLPIKNVAKTADAAGDSVGLVGRFMGTLGKTLGSIGNAIKPIFGVFRTLGRVIFFPLTIIMGVFDSIKGAIEGFKDEGILGGILGAVGGLARGLIGMPLDLLKSGISFIAGKLGFENFSGMLDSFSFSDMIFGMFMKIANIANEIISNLFSGFEDGFGAGMKQMLQSLMIYVKRMMLFPHAIFAGGVAALAAALPGGESPMEAFTRVFSKVITVGEGGSEATTLPSDSGGQGEPDVAPSEEAGKERPNRFERIQARIAREKEEMRRAEERRQQGGGQQVNAVNAPVSTTNVNNATTVMDAEPAIDGLDRFAMGGAF